MVFKCKETPLLSCSKPLSDTLGHLCVTPARPRSARDYRGSVGAACPASGPAPRPAPCGRRGLATLLLGAGLCLPAASGAPAWRPAAPQTSPVPVSYTDCGTSDAHIYMGWNVFPSLFKGVCRSTCSHKTKYF